MQSYFAHPGSRVTPRIAPHEGNTGQLAEVVDAALNRTIERPESNRHAAGARMRLRERLRRLLLIGFPVLMAAVGTAYYLAEEPYVSTDDAFVRSAKESINARVAGQVVKIAVVENQRVQRGQLLFQIDPEPYQIAIDQAEARLGSARLQIDSLKATYRQQLAELQSAKDSADYDGLEYARKKALVASGWTPRALYDRAETDLKVARQHVASIEQQIASTVVALNGDPNIEIDRHPSVRAARAELDRARLDLSYATVTAPDDGIVTRVDDLQVGDFAKPGAAVFSLLSSRHIWIEANFRETGLTHMRPGQEAAIDVDAYPDRTFKAHVVSMSPGTGSDFAVLPPENATGNWVKVVQRLPVRLELDEIDPDRALFSGISVTVRVDTGYRRTWHHPIQTVLATEAAR
jgi:membrane fusion protein (multidrug efflux system)